jgi:hypothetical protein
MDVIAAWKEAGVDLNTADYDGRTALHIVCHYWVILGIDPEISNVSDR